MIPVVFITYFRLFGIFPYVLNGEFFQEMEENEIESVVSEFYGVCPDKLHREKLHGVLLEAQRSSKAWQYGFAFLQPQKAPVVQLFGVNCFYVKLTSSFEEVSEIDGLFGHLREFLYAALCTSSALTAAVSLKLRATVAVLILQAMPDIWPSPVGDLIERWKSVLEILTELPVEYRKLKWPVERKCLVRSLLADVAPKVANLARDVLSACGLVDVGRIVAAVQCVQSWLDFPGSSLQDWKEIVILCLNKCSENSATFEPLAGILMKLSESEELRSLEGFLRELLHFTANKLQPLIREQVADDCTEESLLFRAAVTLAENHTSFFVAELVKENLDDGMLASLNTVTWMLMDAYRTPGLFPVDEKVSDLPANFWFSLQEDAMAITVSRTSEDVVKCKMAVAPVFRHILPLVMGKIRFPTEKELPQWSADDLEEFQRYRSGLSETVSCCYKILGEDVLRFLLDSLTAAVNSADQELQEGALFALEGLADLVPADNQYVEKFLSDLLLILPVSSENAIYGNTALRLLDRLTHVVVTSSRKDVLLPVVVDFILPFLNHENTSQSASLALKNITSERDASLLHVSDRIADACYKTFVNENLLAADRIRALCCIGYIISVQPSDKILDTLNSLLAPRLGSLQSLCHPETKCQKNGLIFEMDVVSALLGTLGTPANLSNTEVQPVYLVLEKSLPLFRSLYVASDGDPDVVCRICDSIKKGTSSLLTDCKALVPEILHLLSLMFPSVSLFGPAKQICLLFASDSDLAPTICDVVLDWTCRCWPLCTAENTDIMEGFLGFAYQLVKKHWLMLAENNSGRLAVPGLIKLAGTTIERCVEAPTTKQAALLLAEVLRHPQSPWMSSAVNECGRKLIEVCFMKIQTLVLTSCVEYIADVMFVLAQSYPVQLRECLGTPQPPLVAAMLKEVANKRKFREFAKQINREARRKLEPKSGRQMSLWTCMDVQAWLKRYLPHIYLKYGELFLEHAVTGRVLVDLTYQMTEMIGIFEGNHRLELVHQVTKMKLRSDLNELMDLDGL